MSWREITRKWRTDPSEDLFWGVGLGRRLRTAPAHVRPRCTRLSLPLPLPGCVPVTWMRGAGTKVELCLISNLGLGCHFIPEFLAGPPGDAGHPSVRRSSPSIPVSSPPLPCFQPCSLQPHSAPVVGTIFLGLIWMVGRLWDYDTERSSHSSQRHTRLRQTA